MANGIIIVDKPQEWTSQDVTAKLRGVFHERRIGHGGTLDPMATGVLPVFVGRATRAVEFMESADKEYEAELLLGTVTDTQDTQGTVLSETEASVTREQLEAVLKTFTGEIAQIPPMYSAVKINGQKLCNLARKGVEIERKPRKITVHSIEILEGSGKTWKLRIVCSKGTYVRTLCHDIGAALGCGGCMASLRRTRAGRFTIENALPLSQILDFSKTQDASELLAPVDSLFSEYPPLIVSMAQAGRIQNGAQIQDRQFPDGTFRVYSEDGRFLALSKSESFVLTTIKSFYEVN